MFKKHLSHATVDLLPWLVNHSLPASDRVASEEQAGRAPHHLAAWQAVRSAALSQPLRAPSATVRQRVLAQTTAAVKPPRWLPVLSGAVLAVLALLVLWNFVQPGIGLHWSVTGAVPASFRVYRAPAGSARFEFVREIPAQADMMEYAFVDTTLWPGQTYQYRIEPVNAEAASATIAASGSEVLPTQLAIVLSSLLIGLAAAYALRELATTSRAPHWESV